MAYILKNAEGNIVAASASRNFGEGWQIVDDSAKDYIAFLESSLAKSAPFRESDIHLSLVFRAYAFSTDNLNFSSINALPYYLYIEYATNDMQLCASIRFRTQ